MDQPVPSGRPLKGRDGLTTSAARVVGGGVVVTTRGFPRLCTLWRKKSSLGQAERTGGEAVPVTSCLGPQTFLMA